MLREVPSGVSSQAGADRVGSAQFMHLLSVISRLIGGAVLALACAPPLSSAASAAPAAAPTLPPVREVGIEDDFWAPKLKIIRERTIPHSWHYMQWELRALQKAAGQPIQGELNGTWGEANLYKFLETVAYALAQQPDPQLERRADEVIALVAGAQQPNGYVHAYITNSRKPQWDPAFLDGSHDGYVLGHLIEAALEYQAATGKRTLLEVARRAADQAYAHFLGPNGRPGFCGHAELEMALVELYRATHEPRYLGLSRAFVEWRGRGKVTPAGPTPRAYFQDAVPLREQRTLEGHAVRAIFFATGVADLALETGEADYRLAAHRFWDSTTLRRMTVTGSIGPRKEHEAFGEDYELPNDGYYESCAACGLADFAQRMFLLERDAEAADVLERALYNTVLHGLELTGTNSYYQNPLSDRDRPRYNSWVCCPPNLSRTLLQAGRYAWAQTDGQVWLHLFIGGTCHLRLGGGEITFRVETDYPWSGRVKVAAQMEKPTRFVLHMRRPGWCQEVSGKLNGAPLATAGLMERGYLCLDREWRPGDIVELEMAMPVQRMLAHPNIESCREQVALQRGPVVYGFEGLDNAGNATITLGADPQLRTVHRADLLGGITAIEGKDAEGRPFTAIPFYALGNRSPSSQEVWARQRGLKMDDSWWEGRHYRPVKAAEIRR